MAVDPKITQRFDELIARGEKVSASLNGSWAEPQLYTAWSTSVLNLLSRVTGTESDHYRNFRTVYDGRDNTEPAAVARCRGVLDAAADDYKNGYTTAPSESIGIF